MMVKRDSCSFCFFLLFLLSTTSLYVCVLTQIIISETSCFLMFLTFEIVMSVSLFNAGIICFIVLQKLYMI